MPAVVRVEELDVNARLRQLGLTREGLIGVLRACVYGFGDCTDNDPPSAKGYETWRYGTRSFREVLLPGDSDWQKDDALPSIRNAKRHIRIIVLNTDDQTGNPNHKARPLNRLPRGSFHERAIKGEWLPGLPIPFADDPKDDVWYFCVYINGDTVQAELSSPDRIDGGFVAEWRERIILMKPGDWRDTLGIDPEGDTGPDIEFDVSLK